MRKGIIDVHAHILPEVDDGARTLEESCELLRMAAAQGISAVIATPHGSGRRSPEKFGELIDRIRQEIQGVLPDFTLYLGEELYYNEGLTEFLASGTALTMAGSRYLLTEFDPMVSYGTLYRGVRTLFSAGYQPVLAHVERYRCLRQGNRLTDLLGSGCLFQMNYDSLQGNRFSPEVRWCRRQVTEGRIHLLGTDMHRLDFRPPDITEAIEWLEGHVDRELMEAMTRENALRMIEGQGKTERNGRQNERIH